MSCTGRLLNRAVLVANSISAAEIPAVGKEIAAGFGGLYDWRSSAWCWTRGYLIDIVFKMPSCLVFSCDLLFGVSPESVKITTIYPALSQGPFIAFFQNLRGASKYIF